MGSVSQRQFPVIETTLPGPNGISAYRRSTVGPGLKAPRLTGHSHRIALNLRRGLQHIGHNVHGGQPQVIDISLLKEYLCYGPNGVAVSVR